MPNQFIRSQFKFILGLISLLLVLALWLVFTTSGAKACFHSLSMIFLPGQIKTVRLEGSLFGGLTFSDLIYQHRHGKLKLKKAELDFNLKSLLNQSFKLNLFKIDGIQIFFPERTPIEITQLSGTLQLNAEQTRVQINPFNGHFHGESINGEIDFIQTPQKITLKKAFLTIGQMTLQAQPAPKQPEHLWFELKTQDQHFHSEAMLTNFEKAPLLRGTLTTDQFTLNQISIPKIQATYTLQFNSAFTEWTLNTQMQPIAFSELKPFFSTHFVPHQGHFQIDLNAYRKRKQPIQAQAALQLSPGSFAYQKNKKQHLLSFEGGQGIVLLKQNHLSAQLQIKQNAQNKLQSQFQIQDLRSPYLTGHLKATLSDLTWISANVEAIDNLVGTLNCQATLKGSLQAPLVSVLLKGQALAFDLPEPQTQVKNFTFTLNNDSKQQNLFTLTGQGEMMPSGIFQLSGSLKTQAPEYEHELNFQGKNISLLNTENLVLIGDPDLQLTYDFKKQVLDLKGLLNLNQGQFVLNRQEKQAVLSSDVVFIDDLKRPEPKPTLKIHPDLKLTLHDIKLQGFGLDTKLSGNLQIQAREDDILLGSGALALNQGTFYLLGRKLYIEKGEFLFPEGTLLTNPMLSVKLLDQKPTLTQQSDAFGLYVQGNLKNPKILPFSTGFHSDSEVLSQLGFSGNHQQTALQAALLMGGGGLSFMDKLQAKLGLEQLGVESQESNQDSNALASTDSTVVVVGKKLSKRLYLQYLQGIKEKTTGFRLKYSLSPRIQVGIDTGTTGSGADLSYSFETD